MNRFFTNHLQILKNVEKHDILTKEKAGTRRKARLCRRINPKPDTHATRNGPINGARKEGGGSIKKMIYRVLITILVIVIVLMAFAVKAK